MALIHEKLYQVQDLARGDNEILVEFGLHEGEYVLTVSDNGIKVDTQACPACPEHSRGKPGRRNGTPFTRLAERKRGG